VGCDLDHKGYEVGETALTMDELIKQYENVSKLAKEMNILIPYMMADIEYKKSRAELFKQIGSHITGLFIVGSITKLGSLVIAFCAPYVLDKIKLYIIGL